MRVMIVAESREFREATHAALATAGFDDVIGAASSRDALELLTADRTRPAVDAVLLDMRLPDADGVETCATIRLQSLYRDTPVVVLAEPGDTRSLSQAFVAGASDYLFKPFHDIELQARMRSILRHKVQIDRRRDGERELQRLRRPGSIWRQAEGPVVDAESGLPGRAALTGSLTWHAGREDGAPLAVIVAQIDALTSYRHLHGAPATSDMLKRVSSTLGAMNARLDSLIAAFETGGYAIVRACAGGDARSFAEEVRARVEALAIPHLESAFHDCVSASVGVAAGARATRERVAQLLPDAICAAEQAAAEGGNRVVVAEEP